MPVLDTAGKRGNLIDPQKREEIRSKLIAMRDEIRTQVQTYVPRELFLRTEYKRLPAELEGTDDPSGPSFQPRAPLTAVGKDDSQWDITFEPEKLKVCTACGRFAFNKSEHFKGSLGSVNPKTGKPTRVKNSCKEAGGTIELRQAFVPRFHRLEEFNPNSSPQLMAYMRHFGHPVGKDKRDSSKDTADANHLKFLDKKFGKHFPLYRLSLEFHKASKTIGTYTPEPDENNRIHTQYVNSTSTWRLGSRKVKYGTQIQNWGKREENKYAKEARQQIIASPGCKLVQTDSSAVEAVMQGYYMNDPEYMSTASKSIHAWLACKALGLPFTPDNVEKVKREHEGLYLKMKVVNYLTNFGGGARLIKDTFPDDFPDLRSAQAAQDQLYALLPTLKAYHHAVRWEAHTKTYLETPWGYRHWYYDVFKPAHDGSIQFGKDAKRCVAMKPQNSNAAFQKDNLLLLATSPIEEAPITELVKVDWPTANAAIVAGETWARFMPTNVSVHDSACLDVESSYVERAKQAELAIFTRPIPEMRGLRIGAEVEIGNNWGAMEQADKVVFDKYDWSMTEAGAPAALAA